MGATQSSASPVADLGQGPDLEAPAKPRPAAATGTFLRIIQINDVYELTNYPRFLSAVKHIKKTTPDCVVLPVLPGDFLSPCTLTTLDRGVAMMKALNMSGVQYVMLGNHEFDLRPGELQKRLNEYTGTVVNSNVSEYGSVIKGRDGKPLPKYEIIKVGRRRVALTGFLLDDMGQFSPVEPTPKIEPPVEAMSKVWNEIKADVGDVDAFLPMVHLNIKDDRVFGKAVTDHQELSRKTPVVLSSHDHEVYIEQVGKTMVIKTGCDAHHIGVIDLFWDKEGTLRRHVHLFDAVEFPLDPGLQKFKLAKDKMLQDMLDIPIEQLPPLGTVRGPAGPTKEYSSVRVRFEPSDLVSWLLSLVKGAMPGVELVMLQGGNVRGASTYHPGVFTYANLMKELAFETQMGIVDLPGSVIEETIRATRSNPSAANGFYLHVDEDAYLTPHPDIHMTMVDGQPFEPDKVYKVATYQFLLSGMGNLEPMMSYVKDHNICPALEVCMPVKHHVMDYCMKNAWCELLFGTDQKHVHTKRTEEQLLQALDTVFAHIDSNGDGYLDLEELLAFVDEKHKNVSKHLMLQMVRVLDQHDDGKVDKNEFHALASVH